MKNLILIACTLIGFVFKVAAQDEVSRAAEQSCQCLKELDPDKINKKELNLTILGCMSRSVDRIAEELKKRNAWSDTSALTYLGKVSKSTRALCPDAFERLKKKEVEVDPALLMIKPEAELVSGFSQAVCNCLGVIKDVEECMGKVGTANEAELKKRMPDSDPFKIMMGVGMDVMFDLADHCEVASFNESIARFRMFPVVKEGCSKLVLGEFSTKSLLGETRSIFTDDKLQEFSEGKLTAEYKLKWKGCSVYSKCTMSNSGMVKKGEETTMEIRRASAEGFIGFVSFGKMRVPVMYNKVK